jgi:hypothetical protein
MAQSGGGILTMAFQGEGFSGRAGGGEGDHRHEENALQEKANDV